MAVIVSPTGGTSRLTRLAHVAGALVRAESVETVIEVVVEQVADATGATVSTLSLLVDVDTLAMIGQRGGRPESLGRWATFAVDDASPAGLAVREGRSVVLDSLDELARRFPDVVIDDPEERAIVCVPLRTADSSIGVMSMSYVGSPGLPAEDLEFLDVLGDICAQAIVRIRSGDQAADRAEMMQFLADSSVELGSSLDYETTIATVARLAVPWFADWCSIAIERDGELRTLAVAHVDPDKVELAEILERRFPPDPASDRGGYAVLRSGRSELTPEITDEMIDASTDDAEHRRLLHALDLRSALVVPLKVQDRVLGVATLVSGTTGRRFGAGDLVFAEDLARRAAQAIETSALHSQLSDMAARLQRAVLPTELPDLPGWEAAVRYDQAGASEAGGDFYDVTPLDDGRVAIMVGDVMGRGVAAAAAMAQMRAAARALVMVDPDPGSVLSALDRLSSRDDLDLVTLLYAVADPGRDLLSVGNAGHPPPVVRRADGRVEVLSGSTGLLLGAGSGEERRTALQVPFAEGDLLFAYTDGLVERRDEDIDVGIDRVVDACRAREPGALPHWLDSVVEQVRDPQREDDVAALTIRRQGLAKD